MKKSCCLASTKTLLHTSRCFRWVSGFRWARWFVPSRNWLMFSLEKKEWNVDCFSRGLSVRQSPNNWMGSALMLKCRIKLSSEGVLGKGLREVEGRLVEMEVGERRKEEHREGEGWGLEAGPLHASWQVRAVTCRARQWIRPHSDCREC